MSDQPDAPDHDALIEELRARAADPTRRTEYVPSLFESSVRSMSIGGMLSLGRSLGDSLRRVVESNQAGRMPDPDVAESAERLQQSMSSPAPVSAGALRRATRAEVDRVETALGVTLPPFVARLYTEVGDGGFGPGQGLIGLEQLVRETRELRSGGVLPRGRAWPPALLPIVDRDPGWFCLDAVAGTIVEWDPEELDERSGEERFRRSFSEVSPSMEAWLARWLRRMAAADRKPSAEDRWARMAARAQTPEGMARQEAKTRAYLEQMSPEDRKRWGLDALYPDIGLDGPPREDRD